MLDVARRVLLGAPLATQRMHLERLALFGGLAVFAADALSSVAYGPEEVLIILEDGGPEALRFLLPIACAIVALVAIVSISYRQTVLEYPNGGGAYVVARDNLGAGPSHVAGAALLSDYVLTVAVSVSSGTAALTSAWPILQTHTVTIAVASVLLIMLVNLRGVRESAAVFAGPVYFFVACVLVLIGVGLFRAAHGLSSPTAAEAPLKAAHSLSAFMVLRAFSSGCATLTGVEAVANGVQAFREPCGRNAARAMVALACLLGTMALGTSLLAHFFHVLPKLEPGSADTVMSQIGTLVFGRGAMYLALQISTALVLILAANTSFADFPRLSAFMARDGYMPRQMATIGNRLVFSNGIVILSLLACTLIVVFHAEVTRLIPLYAVGVFTAFTLSQTGMVVHWRRQAGQGWKTRALVNGIGAIVTGVVLGVIAVTKFVHGAWIVCLMVPLMVAAFRRTRRHYDYVTERLTPDAWSSNGAPRNVCLILVGGMTRGVLEGLSFARSLGCEARGIHIETEGRPSPPVQEAWSRWVEDVPLVVLDSPYRHIAGPLVEYIQKVQQEEGFDIVTVILPEFVVPHWWEPVLHNQTAVWLHIALRAVPGVAVVSLRYRL